ncbi:MAG: hypothetical protein QOI73_3648 [Solirubrobacteraceae bacterium]|nr:hypothetical protein [Solirubrobacteraceae bacterium]
MNGRLDPAGDRWRLRFERRLRHPVEKVLRAVTEPEHLQAWFPQPAVEGGERWQEVHPGYAEAFGAEASAIGPPAGAL